MGSPEDKINGQFLMFLMVTLMVVALLFSRSRAGILGGRKAPISGITTAESEKQDKQIANRRERHRNRQILGCFLDDAFLMYRKQAGNPWLMEKDGKAFFVPEKYPELMRK